MKRQFPLEALAKVRKHEMDVRVHEKTVATEHRRKADRQAGEAAERKRLEQIRRRDALEVESARLDAGRARAGDLVQAEHFRREADRRIRESEKVESSAIRDRSVAIRLEHAALTALAGAHEAEKAVSRHRARFRADERRSIEKNEEKAREETWQRKKTERKRTGE